ncbi:MAG: HupE/UreJ family protein [Pseudomonadota bacterium]
MKRIGQTARASRAALLLFAALWPALSLAHSETGVGGGLAAGLLHPVLGLDHLVAMVAVGLWGAQLGAPSIWLLPVVFPAVMAAGALLGLLQMPLPGVEYGIALSACLLGLLVAMKLKAPVALAGVIVGVFAIFHGHAHGTEVPEAANPLAYGVGFVVATGLLHLAGILLGLLLKWPAGDWFVRACGAAVAAVGAFFLFGSA